MRDLVATKLAVFVATLAVADRPEYAALWKEKSPLAFTDTLTIIGPLLAALRTKGVYEGTIEDCPGSLRTLRHDLEVHLHLISRAALRCLLNQGHPEEAQKVDVLASELAKTRPFALVERGESILETAEALFLGTPPPAAKYFNHLQFDAADQLWQKFTVSVGAPPTSRGKRKGLNHGLLAEVRAIEVLLATCDDLIIQFAIGNEQGERFVHEWFEARCVDHLKAQPSREPGTISYRVLEEEQTVA